MMRYCDPMFPGFYVATERRSRNAPAPVRKATGLPTEDT